MKFQGISSSKTARFASVIIVGAGHAGVSVSRLLSDRSIDHVVFERGEIANAWRFDRWDSLRLITPNWKLQLPGFAYEGADPSGFMGKEKVADFIASYASRFALPLHNNTEVISVEKTDDGYRVFTNRGTWLCRSLVLASGALTQPIVPKLAQALPSSINQLHSKQYRNPSQIPDGGVLVVGASASGLQIADELNRAGKEVTLCAGEHVRIPRVYRGKDLFWWMDHVGLSDDRFSTDESLKHARGVPSPQLIGTAAHSIYDINLLKENGVKVAGKLLAINNGGFQFSGGFNNVCKLADLKLNRLLDLLDSSVTSGSSLEKILSAPMRYQSTKIDEQNPLSTSVSSIKSVIWATGLKGDYSWLNVPVLDNKFQLIHSGGVTSEPGLFAIGLPVMRTRHSSYLHGISSDAEFIAARVAKYILGERDMRYSVA